MRLLLFKRGIILLAAQCRESIAVVALEKLMRMYGHRRA